MCFSLKASLLSLAVNWVASACLWHTGETWTRWRAAFGFWVGLVQVADAGLWYAHEVDGQHFQDCTRTNQWFTALALGNISLQAFAMFVASYAHRRVSAKRKAVEMLISLASLCCWCALAVWNECRDETEGIYFCSQLSETRTIDYGYGKDKWGTNKCLRRGVFFGDRISDNPAIVIILHMAVITYPAFTVRNEAKGQYKKRLRFAAISAQFCFWPAFYFGSLSSVWCFLGSFWPACVLLGNWLFPIDSVKPKAK